MYKMEHSRFCRWLFPVTMFPPIHHFSVWGWRQAVSWVCSPVHAHLSFYGVGERCAAPFLQLFYCHWKSDERGFAGTDKAGFLSDSASSDASAPFWNHGSIICRSYCRFFGIYPVYYIGKQRIAKTKDIKKNPAKQDSPPAAKQGTSWKSFACRLLCLALSIWWQAIFRH